MQILSAIFLWVSLAGATVPVPKLTGAIVDGAGLISSDMKARLETTLRTLSASGTAQLAILTVPTIEDETIEQYSIRVVDQWKLGDPAKDNGVLLLVATKERKVRIEVGQGLEGDLTDAHSKRIIDRDIIPQFRNGDFEMGIVLGAKGIVEKVAPDFVFDLVSTSSYEGRGDGWKGKIPLLIFVIVLMALFGRGPRGRSRRATPFILGGWGSTRRGGGYGGGFSGGSFGGGGGGSFGGGGGGFSGGGASGGW